MLSTARGESCYIQRSGAMHRIKGGRTMEGLVYNRVAFIAFVSSGITFIMVIVHEAVRHITGSPIMAIDWAANALMVITSFYIRGHVDEKKYRKAVMESVPDGRQVNPLRFINGMPGAMVVGLAAEITIRYNFIAGMILYLVMQVLLIYSFTGILPFRFSDFRNGESRNYYRVITVLWLLVPGTLFYLFIHNGLQTSIVIPYMLILCVMTIVTYFAYSLGQRPLVFRLAPAAASTLFVISDILVGYVAFNNPVNKCYAAISMTYITAMLLFNVTILFLKTKNDEYVVS
jgi:hypothetical protein